MRREGYIIEEIVEYGNMSDSFDTVLRGTKRKRSRQGRWLLAHRDEVIRDLTERIASGTFTVKDYREREIVEGGKLRKIQVLSMYDRIGVHAVMNVVDRHMRKRIKQKMARKMHEVRSRKRRRELIASFYGMAKHANCNMLFNKLTGKQMKSFKDLKVAYKPEDGKKRFSGAVVSIRELVNLPIVVKDFETGIKTEQGEDRCIVAIEQNGEPKKFFTNSEEMKNILAQIREMPDGFPFETTIKTETFGKGRTKYVFT